jgi:hypothetical protein
MFELRSLFELELYRGNDTAAITAAEQYLKAQPQDEYPWAIAQIVRDLLAARPMRLATAETMMARLDSLGDLALEPRYIAHNQLNIISENRFDIPRMEQEGWILYRLRRQMTPPQLRDGEMHGNARGGYERFLATGARRPLRFTGAPNSWDVLKEMLDIEVTRSSTLREAVFRVVQTAMAKGMDSTDIQEQLRLITRNPSLGFARLGNSVLPLRATFWFSAPGDTIWPRKNHVTVLIRRNAGMAGIKSDATIRHLRQRFGDTLDIVIYTPTVGFFRDSRPLSPTEEAEKLRWYYLDYLKLPISALAVRETKFTKRPDGRRVAQRPVDDYFGFLLNNFILVGKNGTLRHEFFSSRGAMEAAIAYALAQ